MNILMKHDTKRTSLMLAAATSLMIGGGMMLAPEARAQACVAGQMTMADGTVAECSGAAAAVPTGENADAEGAVRTESTQGLAPSGTACIAGQTANENANISCSGAAQTVNTGENVPGAPVETEVRAITDSSSPAGFKVDDADK